MDTQKNLLMVVGEWLQERQQRQLVRAEEKATTRRLSRWLPSPGSVVFTLCMIGLLLWAQTAGALPLPGYLNAPDAPSTGTIAYQGRLADANGNPLTNTVNMEFRLYNAATGGTPLWDELWTGSNAVQVSDGLFNVMLGSLTPIPQNIMTGNSSLWLGITAGTDDEMMPRVQLGSVPFAVQALTVPDGSVTTVKLADGAVTSSKILDRTVLPVDASLDSWGLLARSQGLIVMPEGSVTDDGNGNITIMNSLIIMNPLAGSFVRVSPGTYHLDPWGYLFVNLPPTVTPNSTVTPQIGQWVHATRPFDGTDRFLLAQRMSGGKVWFRFGWQAP